MSRRNQNIRKLSLYGANYDKQIFKHKKTNPKVITDTDDSENEYSIKSIKYIDKFYNANVTEILNKKRNREIINNKNINSTISLANTPNKNYNKRRGGKYRTVVKIEKQVKACKYQELFDKDYNIKNYGRNKYKIQNDNIYLDKRTNKNIKQNKIYPDITLDEDVDIDDEIYTTDLSENIINNKKGNRANNKKVRCTKSVVKKPKANNNKKCRDKYCTTIKLPKKYVDDGYKYNYEINNKGKNYKKNNNNNLSVKKTRGDYYINYKSSVNKNDYNDYKYIPSLLPCREEEQNKIKKYIINGLQTKGGYNSLLITGMCGTGKTECLNNVINIVEKELDNKIINIGYNQSKFIKIMLSGVNFPNINNIYKIIYQSIFPNNNFRKNNKNKDKIYMSNPNYALLLDNFFKNRYSIKYPDNHILLVIDEIDYLLCQNQRIFYNIFNWTNYEYSKLILIAISNTIDLYQRLDQNIESRIGNNHLVFKPYTKEQFYTIFQTNYLHFNNFSTDALKICFMKVAAINGDIRRVFNVLNKAKDLYEYDIKHNKCKKKEKIISKEYISRAYIDLYGSREIKLISSLQLYEKIVLGAILLKIKQPNNQIINVAKYYEQGINTLINKYNDFVENENDKLELYWDEYKNIVCNLVRIGVISFDNENSSNFIDNCINIKFDKDEFIAACEMDKSEDGKTFYNNFINFIIVNFNKMIYKK